MRLDEAVDAPWLRDAVALGLDFMRRSQGPAGGWPQAYPPRGGYADHYTFNDGVTNAAITVMLRAWRAYGDRRDREAALRAADFIARTRLQAPHEGWAQQYQAQQLRPASARAFEPAAADSAVTAGNFMSLLEVYAEVRDDGLLRPIAGAMAWLERAAIREGKWARFYELGTGRPIYPARDGTVHYSRDALPGADRERYAYEGSFDIPAAQRTYREFLKGPGDDPVGWFAGRREAERRRGPGRRLGAPGEVGAGLDANGHWVEDGGEIVTATFVRNCTLILDHLEQP